MFKKIAVSIARILVLLTGVLIVLWLVLARPYPVFESQKIVSDIEVDQALLLKHVRTLSEDFSPRDYVIPLHWLPTRLKSLHFSQQKQWVVFITREANVKLTHRLI